MTAFATLAPVYSMPPATAGDAKLSDSSTDAHSAALNRFLADVELKAFRMAQATLRHEDDSLDVVQEAMLQLARSYGARPPHEWRPLFYRILENKIRDLQRRRIVRKRVLAWLPLHRSGEDAEEIDPVAQAPSGDPEPPKRLELAQAMQALDGAIAALPRRQRQAFLLRNLEGMDVEQTASTMGCTQGSVKTHYFRALQTLRAALGEFYEPE